MSESIETTNPETAPWWKNRRNQLIFLGVVIVVLAVIAGVVIAKQQSSKAEQAGKTEDVQKDERVPRTLDGVLVSAGEENLLPVAIMIENLSSVRPQSGLGEAQVVYEALAEGGITRFMAVFGTRTDLDRIGPIRSAREYYVDWAEEYGGAYLHAGGSPGALAQLSGNKKLTDVNQISGDSAFFYRDPAIGAPHNLFTRATLLEAVVNDKVSENAQGSFTPWTFASKQQQATTSDVGATSVTIPFSSAAYSVQYQYDAAEKRYMRLNGGKPHTDAETDKQISAKTVIVQYTTVNSTNDDKNRVDVDTKKGGKAIVFVEGKAIDGTWEYNAKANRTVFVDAQGDEIVFEPGTIWVSVVPVGANVEYTEITAAQ